MNDLVSIITPCYNSASYIYRLLDSIMMQDYPCIEVYAVDDGSTDNTREVIESYIEKYAEKGYILNYIYQENAGQAAAVNRGLKYVKGEYLAWPDSDDYYNCNNAISTFVHELNQLDSSYGVVCNIGTFVDEVTLKPTRHNTDYNKRENLFETCLLGGDFLAVPINYMIRMEAFDKVNPQREIYTKRHVQNMQMLLPLFYSYKCKTFHQSLCNIVERTTSYSRSSISYDKQKDEIQGWLDIKRNTLDSIVGMSDENRGRYKKRCIIKDLFSKLELALNHQRKQDAYDCIRNLKKMGVKVGIKSHIKAFLLSFPSLYAFLKR